MDEPSLQLLAEFGLRSGLALLALAEASWRWGSIRAMLATARFPGRWTQSVGLEEYGQLPAGRSYRIDRALRSLLPDVLSASDPIAGTSLANLLNGEVIAPD